MADWQRPARACTASRSPFSRPAHGASAPTPRRPADPPPPASPVPHPSDQAHLQDRAGGGVQGGQVITIDDHEAAGAVQRHHTRIVPLSRLSCVDELRPAGRAGRGRRGHGEWVGGRGAPSGAAGARQARQRTRATGGSGRGHWGAGPAHLCAPGLLDAGPAGVEAIDHGACRVGRYGIPVGCPVARPGAGPLLARSTRATRSARVSEAPHWPRHPGPVRAPPPRPLRVTALGSPSIGSSPLMTPARRKISPGWRVTALLRSHRGGGRSARGGRAAWPLHARAAGRGAPTTCPA